jgi:hypothetical protein
VTRARATMMADMAWLEQQVPCGSPAQLVEFALHQTTSYGDYASRRTSNERPDAKAWYDEAKAKNLKLVGEMFPELADECSRQIRELHY